jgi:hypothetical protein
LNNTVKNNHADDPISPFGGGMRMRYTETPSLVRGNTFSNNSVSATGNSSGGGIGLMETQSIIITENKFQSDSSNLGGGICDIGSVGNIISDNEFINNGIGPFGSAGGGFACIGSNNLAVTRNLFKHNSALQFGGLLSINSDLLLTNNNFINNEAAIGGAILIARDIGTDYIAEIINNSITGNIADSAGALTIMDAEVMFMNTICWGNNAAFAPEIYMKGGKLNVAYSDIRFGADSIRVTNGGTLNWLDGNMDTNPLFADTSAQLSDVSPCISTGVVSYDFGDGLVCLCPAEDINERPRPSPAGTIPDMGAWESLEGIIDGIKSNTISTVPNDFLLGQNYPNPFNAETVICYVLPVTCHIELCIYNLLGQKVAVLVSQQQSAGQQRVTFDGQNLPSGIYYYKLTAGTYTQVKKMLLIR